MPDKERELKSCPFCGAQPLASLLVIEGAVQCPDCKAMIIRRHNLKTTDGMAMAIKAWNTRPPSVIPSTQDIESIIFRDIRCSPQRAMMVAQAIHSLMEKGKYETD